MSNKNGDDIIKINIKSFLFNDNFFKKIIFNRMKAKIITVLNCLKIIEQERTIKKARKIDS